MNLSDRLVCQWKIVCAALRHMCGSKRSTHAKVAKKRQYKLWEYTCHVIQFSYLKLHLTNTISSFYARTEDLQLKETGGAGSGIFNSFQFQHWRPRGPVNWRFQQNWLCWCYWYYFLRKIDLIDGQIIIRWLCWPSVCFRFLLFTYRFLKKPFSCSAKIIVTHFEVLWERFMKALFVFLF